MISTDIFRRILSVSGIRIGTTLISLIVIGVVIKKYGPDGAGYYFLFALYRLSGIFAIFVEASTEQIFSHYFMASSVRLKVAERVLKSGAFFAIVAGIPLSFALQALISELIDDPVKKLLIQLASIVWAFELVAEIAALMQRIKGKFEICLLFQALSQVFCLAAFWLCISLTDAITFYALGIALCSLGQGFWAFNFKKMKLCEFRRSGFVLIFSHKRNITTWSFSIVRSIVVQTERWAVALLLSVSLFGLYSVLLRLIGIMKMLLPTSAQISWFYSNTPKNEFKRRFRTFQYVFMVLWVVGAIVICVMGLSIGIRNFILIPRDIVAASMFMPVLIYASASVVDLWKSKRLFLINGALIALTLFKLLGFLLVAKFGNIANIFYLSGFLTLIHLVIFDRILGEYEVSVRHQILSRRELNISIFFILAVSTVLIFMGDYYPHMGPIQLNMFPQKP